MKRFVKKVSEFLPHEVRRSLYRVVRPAKYHRGRGIPTAAHEVAQWRRSSPRPTGLFIHIPKCAGVAVSQSLFGDCASRHLTITDYMFVFSEEELSSLFTFTIVRNPWDRLVSAYIFLKHGGVNESDRRWASKHISQFEDFEQFAKGWVTKRNVEKSLHFRPQVRFLRGPRSRRVRVDFVGYFENLPNDFALIAERLGVSATLVTMNTTPHKRGDYKSYYTDETRRIVADVYREDVETFGYDFENATLDLALKNRGSLVGSSGTLQ